jgi:hypothetical protein
MLRSVAAIQQVMTEQLFDANYFEISATQHKTHYSPAGNGVGLDTVVYENICHMSVSVTCLIHLPRVCQMVDLATTNKLLDKNSVCE